MEFQASARKWRPQKFSELIGQDHIVQTLGNAIKLDRVAHAYLFSGTRGVGKTTTARILAKALNCEKGPTAEPCDKCSFCVEIREGNSIDVQEIDGASNNSVAEVRELIENVQYSTSSCRYKVYIIDEVHMLSKSAFNALLKTLEEPPPRVVFLFATTELIKIPDTILSRCQCFEFKPLSHKQITAQLDLICKHEKIEIDELSLDEITKTGAGSMRDAQSLLDQVVAFCGKKIDHGAVESVLGIVGQSALQEFVDNLISKNSAKLVELVREVVDKGKDLNYFCRDLTEYIRNLMFVKIAKDPASLLNTQVCNLDALKTQAENFHADELQQMFNLLSKAEMDMKRSSLAQMVFEMAVLRLVDTRPYKDIDQLITKINQMEGDEAPKKKLQTPETVPTPSAPPDAQPATDHGSNNGAEWQKIREEILVLKPHFDHFLSSCRLVFLDTRSIHLSFPDPYTLGLVEKEENVQVIKDAVKQALNYNDIQVKLDCKSAPAKAGELAAPDSEDGGKKSKVYDKMRSPSEEEILKDALDIFGGVVIR